MAAVSVRVLGPVEAEVDGEVVALTHSHRLLLARLAVASTPVSALELAEILGSETCPVTVSTVKSHLSRLRASLGGGSVITSAGRGYRLVLAEGGLDRDRFEALLRSARGAPPAVVSWRLREADALWRGPAFGDLATEWFAMAEAARLDELRVSSLEARIDADLELGRHEALIPELEALARCHPTRERIRRHLATALAGCGRHGEALRTLAGLRSTLVDELGLDPSDETKDLERRILDRDPTLSARPRAINRSTVRPLTPLVGRAREVERAASAIVERRLVVLTGLGGVGKSRIAFEAAERVADRFGSGITHADVARAPDPDSLLSLIAAGLRLRATSTEELVALLASEHLLLVLDGCENWLQGVREMLDQLLPAAPTLHVLATSREVLALPGEVTIQVEGLPPSDAVALFTARAADAGVILDPDDEQVRGLCAALDGLPLALELAAARVDHSSVRELMANLDRRFDMLSRPGGGRHASVGALLDQTWEQLGDDEQRLLAAAATFAAPCTLDAMTAVAATGGRGALGSLVRRSLVVAVPAACGGPTTFRLLDTVRAHARQRAAASAEDLARRHRQWHIDYAESVGEPVRALSSVRAEELAVHQPDIELAVRGSIAEGETAAAARLLSATATLWRTGTGSHFQFAREALEQVLSSDLPADTVVACRGLASFLARMQVHPVAAEEHARVGTAIDGDSGWRAWCWGALALSSSVRGTGSNCTDDVDYARHAVDQAHRLLEDVDDWWRLFVGWDMGNAFFTLGEVGTAHAELASALEAVPSNPHTRHDETLVRACDSLALHLLGRDREAVDVAKPVLAELEDQSVAAGWLTSQPRAFVAPALAATGEVARATTLLLDSLPRVVQIATALNAGDFVISLGAVKALSGEWEPAAMLLGAARALGRHHPIPFRTPMGLALYRHWIQRVREALGSDACRAGYARGAELGVDATLVELFGQLP